MDSLKLFCSFYQDSYKKFTSQLRSYLGSYIAQVFIGFLAAIPWTMMGYESNSPTEMFMTLINVLLSLMVIVNVVLIEKAKMKGSEKESLMYATPTYLIYTLYTTIIILAGLFLLVVPGVIAAVLLAMVPLAAVLIDNDSVNYFKLSIKMAKSNPGIIVWFGIFSVLIEAPNFGLDFISNWNIKLLLKVVYTFIDSALLILLTITSVRIFYHLKTKIGDLSS